MDYNLLKNLVAVQGASSDESRIRDFVLNHVLEHKQDWKVQPKIIMGEEFQDQLILVFGRPKTAIFAHIDTIGYSVGYDDELIKIGGPASVDGITLVGKDTQGDIAVELSLYEDDHGKNYPHFISDRVLDRGTILTYQPNFRETDETIQSPYLDNRLGVFVALEVAKTMENGAIVFSTYEEHGGNSVAFCAKYLQENFATRQALICDITWATEGVKQGGGVAISMRDSGLPRRSYLNRIIEIAREEQIPFQLEVESAGGSDGGMLQKSDALWDWCFIGAAEENVHSPDELVYKNDVESMVELYQLLIQKL
ncbi:MAG: aminopeptidase [Bacteroidetes bacterium]|nr:aminopeptidase [Bacteroidota bacterium]